MNNEDRLSVALCKEACPLCGHIEDGPIVMNTKLTVGAAQKVKELHGQTIGYMDKPCKECRDIMSKGFLLIGFVEEKSPDMKNPYRSGNKWGITLESAHRLFEGMDLTKGAMFIDVKVADKMGFPNANINA